MTTLFPLPDDSCAAPRIIRIGLGFAAAAGVIAGQLLTKGALYGYSVTGIAFGSVLLAKSALGRLNGLMHLMAFVGPIAFILIMMLFAALIVMSVGGAICAACLHHAGKAGRLAVISFAGLAVFILIGLASSWWLQTRPDYPFEGRMEGPLFVWPAVFTTLSFLYAWCFHRRSRT